MKKSLIIAEKPSVGRDIARVLGCDSVGHGSIDGEKYIVTWALGHLVTLADPEAYDKKFAKWVMEDLPILPGKMRLVVMKGSGRQFAVINELLGRDDVSDVIIATDAGREGELVARWILEKAGSKKPIRRLWISSVTDKAIMDGFRNLKDGRNFDNLYRAAEARAEADWIVGINATRALTTKYNAQLSCGRVQTPTLAMVVSREHDIRAFKPKDYFGILVRAGGLSFRWRDDSGSDRSYSLDKIKQIESRLAGAPFTVMSINKTEKKMPPPDLYDLTTLQHEAYQKYGFSAKKTQSVMQSLYETHKVLTYPRTDSRHLTSDMADSLKERVEACGTGELRPVAFKLMKKDLKPAAGVIDDSKVSDHHAIVPTEVSPFSGELSSDELKIYDMVARRFLSVFAGPYVYEQVVVEAEAAGACFKVKGNTAVSPGWRALYGNSEDDPGYLEDMHTLPEVSKGQVLSVEEVRITKGKTAPPRRFNEGTLLKAMENPQKYLRENDSALKKVLGETGGIGTVATRADIIEKLFKSFLMESVSGEIKATSKGEQLLELVPDDLKSPDLTAEWELRLNAIARGDERKSAFIEEMRGYTRKIITEISRSAQSYKHDNLTREKCPQCGKFLLKVRGKRGELLVCQDRECGYRKSLSTTTNARCPECRKKLKLVGEGEGKKFVCKCGYREKLSSFNKRKKEEGKKGSVRDVRQFLKDQQSESEPFNTALADKLKGLFEDKS